LIAYLISSISAKKISKSVHACQSYNKPKVGRFSDTELLPAALRASQTCRYLIYSEADFEVFRPAGATHCTDGVKFGTAEGTVPSSVPNVTPLVQ